MRVLLLNAWGGRVYDPLLPFLRETDPDILCLEEVTRTADAPADWLVYRDQAADLPQRADLFADVAAALPEHAAYFCPAARGDLFHGEETVKSDWGLATFVRRTHPVIGQAQDFVHGGFVPNGWGEHPRARNAHAVRVFDPVSSRFVTVAHMHGLRDLAGKGDTPARHAQAQAFIALIQKLRRANDRMIVCGDFNVLPDSETVRMLRHLDLTELVTSRGHTDTRTSHYKKAPRFADYMLVSADVEVRTFEVIAAPEVSDHRALLLDLK